MKRMKMIYAAVLAAIYMAASLFSSLDVLLCDHPHHHHHHTVHTHSHSHCTCHNHSADSNSTFAFETACCDHEHELLGEHHTAFIVEKERGDDNILTPLTLDLGEAIVAVGISLDKIADTPTHHDIGYESTPLQAAFTRFDSLRAPPVLA